MTSIGDTLVEQAGAAAAALYDKHSKSKKKGNTKVKKTGRKKGECEHHKKTESTMDMVKVKKNWTNVRLSDPRQSLVDLFNSEESLGESNRGGRWNACVAENTHF